VRQKNMQAELWGRPAALDLQRPTIDFPERRPWSLHRNDSDSSAELAGRRAFSQISPSTEPRKERASITAVWCDINSVSAYSLCNDGKGGGWYTIVRTKPFFFGHVQLRYLIERTLNRSPFDNIKPVR